MEKDEMLKFFNENGETVLMTKSEYLELAKQKGWDTKIPQLEGDIYSCDIFGGDGVKFAFTFAISGTLCLEDNADFGGNVLADDGIILGDYANTYNLSSDNGDVVLGDNADTFSITGKNVICGDNLDTNVSDISATDGFVILGKDFDSYDGSIEVSATEDIICDDEPTAAEDSQNS